MPKLSYGPANRYTGVRLKNFRFEEGGKWIACQAKNYTEARLICGLPKRRLKNKAKQI